MTQKVSKATQFSQSRLQSPAPEDLPVPTVHSALGREYNALPHPHQRARIRAISIPRLCRRTHSAKAASPGAHKRPALLRHVVVLVVRVRGVATRRREGTTTTTGTASRRRHALLVRRVLARLGLDQRLGVLEVAVDALDRRVDAVFLHTQRFLVSKPSPPSPIRARKKKDIPCESAPPAPSP